MAFTTVDNLCILVSDLTSLPNKILILCVDKSLTPSVKGAFQKLTIDAYDLAISGFSRLQEAI